MKKLPLTFGAALQIAVPPHKARKEINLTKLANDDTGTVHLTLAQTHSKPNQCLELLIHLFIREKRGAPV